MTSSRDTVLAGDIGGTKTNLGLFSRGHDRPVPDRMESFPSRDAANLEEIVARFLDTPHSNIPSACFGIAGPVKQGYVKTTNLPWDVSARSIEERFGFSKVSLVNDLVATAMAIPLLTDREETPLNSVAAPEQENLGLVAPGTGLGMALLVAQEERYVPVPSEGGHVEFAPRDEREVDLWRFLRKQFGHVSVERVISGPALYSIYQWLSREHAEPEPQWLKERFATEAPPRVVTDAAMNSEHPVCVEALHVWVSVLGAVAGNLALTGLTRGGMYLGGGIVPNIMPKLQDGTFMNAFTDKGRFADLMAGIPVKVIMNDKAALLGAASLAFQNVQ